MSSIPLDEADTVQTLFKEVVVTSFNYLRYGLWDEVQNKPLLFRITCERLPVGIIVKNLRLDGLV